MPITERNTDVGETDRGYHCWYGALTRQELWYRHRNTECNKLEVADAADDVLWVEVF